MKNIANPVNNSFALFNLLTIGQMSEFKVGAKKALTAVTHLLYEIHEQELNNVAARLVQQTEHPIATYCTASGYWSFDVVREFLRERGIKCTAAAKDNQWLLDAPRFLRSNPAIVGFIDGNTLETFKWDKAHWSTTSASTLVLPKQYLFAVHKMWIPIEHFYADTFHLTTDNAAWTRHEYQPSSCWRGERVNYEGCENAVKRQMKAHKKSAIMMSNNTEMLLCKPGPKGWKTETLLNYEGIPIIDAAQQVSEELSTILVQHIETLEPGYAWSVMAHALFGAYQHLGGKLRTEDLSRLSSEELQTLRDYEQGLVKATKQIQHIKARKQ